VLVNAIGKKASKVFRLPKFSLSVICFGPSDVLVGRVKSGALVPTASGMAEFQYKIDISSVKKDRVTVGAFESFIADSPLTDHDSPIPWKRFGGCLPSC
jgi:hypothetical protein